MVKGDEYLRLEKKLQRVAKQGRGRLMREHLKHQQRWREMSISGTWEAQRHRQTSIREVIVLNRLKEHRISWKARISAVKLGDVNQKFIVDERISCGYQGMAIHGKAAGYEWGRRYHEDWSSDLNSELETERSNHRRRHTSGRTLRKTEAWIQERWRMFRGVKQRDGKGEKIHWWFTNTKRDH